MQKYTYSNIWHWPNAGWMLSRRRRRRANIYPALGQCIVFAGKIHVGTPWWGLNKLWLCTAAKKDWPTLAENWVNITASSPAQSQRLSTVLSKSDWKTPLKKGTYVSLNTATWILSTLRKILQYCWMFLDYSIINSIIISIIATVTVCYLK